MAINMMCMNSDCKYYWEDMCTRNVNEERIVIGYQGVCETFEKGVSEWYEEIEEGPNDIPPPPEQFRNGYVWADGEKEEFNDKLSESISKWFATCEKGE